MVENYIENNLDLNIQLINQVNRRVFLHAQNTALKIAKGDFIALLDADDEWFHTKTDRQMNVFKNNDLEVDFLGCRKKNHIVRFPYKVCANNLIPITFRKLMLRNEMGSQTVIIKRKVLRKYRFF
ncbi:glycosyltransferase [Halpernia sp. GG3]